MRTGRYDSGAAIQHRAHARPGDGVPLVERLAKVSSEPGVLGSGHLDSYDVTRFEQVNHSPALGPQRQLGVSQLLSQEEDLADE